MSFALDDYNFDLPEELIAQAPSENREGSRLMILDRADGSIEHGRFSDLSQYFGPDHVLVTNDARVVPVRLLGKKASGGRVELLLLNPPVRLVGNSPVQSVGQTPTPDSGPGFYEIECLAKPVKRLKPGTPLLFGGDLKATVKEILDSGRILVNFEFSRSPVEVLERQGLTPLPPYIKRSEQDLAEDARDRERYQTVYARASGAVAAPTAGLHFTSRLLSELKSLGVEQAMLTLLVGLGTFAPVKVSDIRQHSVEAEHLVLPESTADLINRGKEAGKTVTAVGTTAIRSLEFAARKGLPLSAYEGMCDLFISPGFEFRVVDRLLTNFHLPGSSLLILAASFAGLETILNAYRAAIEHGYRFYSYGDAMLII